MDGTRFDGIARALARGTTRRSTLAAGLAALVGAGSLGVLGTEAKRKRGKETPCRRSWTWCGEVPSGPSKQYTRCNFVGITVPGINVSGADFTDANLAYTDFTGANLQGASLRGACLTVADFSDADLTGVNFSGAELSGAQLYGADLRGAKISQDQLDSAFIGCGTVLPDGQATDPCAEGEICCGGTCTVVAVPGCCSVDCTKDIYAACGGDSYCASLTTTEETCGCFAAFCGEEACTTSEDCGEGGTCVVAPGCCDCDGCAGERFCAYACGSEPLPPVEEGRGAQRRLFTTKAARSAGKAKRHRR